MIHIYESWEYLTLILEFVMGDLELEEKDEIATNLKPKPAKPIRNLNQTTVIQKFSFRNTMKI